MSAALATRVVPLPAGVVAAAWQLRRLLSNYSKGLRLFLFFF